MDKKKSSLPLLPSSTSITSSSFLFRPFHHKNLPSSKNISTLTTTNPAAVPTVKFLYWHCKILDPDSDFVSRWNYVFLASCIIALFIDPLYFYLPTARRDGCLERDTDSGFYITFFRSVADLFYTLHIFMKFRTAFVSPSSRVFGRGELVMDPYEISMRYFRSDFIIDLAAALPLPQLVIWYVIPAIKTKSNDNSTLALIVLAQYIPRLFVIFPLNQRIIKTTGVVAKTAWSGAAYNLLLFLLASHVVGATWYLLSIGRQFECWREECETENEKRVLCNLDFLDCSYSKSPERLNWVLVTNVIKKCNADHEGDDAENFKFGIFGDAFTDSVASEPSIIRRILYCLWWGLRSLSSYAQEFDTSVYIGENIFAILICISGSFFSALLIGNMQKYLQSMTVRFEEWRVKRRDTEEWMKHRQLPEDLRERVRQFVQYKWQATRGVNEESILRSLPLDLRREIQRHLCIALVRRVPFFAQMDDQLLDAICQRLISSLSIQDTYIVREGDPVNEMLFIIRGKLESSTTNGGRSGFFNSITLRPGDFCGEELLTWALMPYSTLNFPSSTRTVRALCEVEAFALQAEDLKFVANQFKKLHSKRLQHAFRYYSHQWRTWAACFIQSAWRRFRKRKMTKELIRREGSFYYKQIPDQDSYYMEEVADGNHEYVHGSTGGNAAAQSASNVRNAATQQKVSVPGVDAASSSLKMPKMFKPDEPDFSVDQGDV
ncbi:hypothetical protein Patl1_02708 [Pistacia atlantica]|uniref:Uncharacterized protein n=1 Tax=Pistacia atlantica TaxID=434234 RepID=A0ACC1C4M8_9ROSI|nr:hypothetical protein Patl1_02708 [Pistacia atlantica]